MDMYLHINKHYGQSLVKWSTSNVLDIPERVKDISAEAFYGDKGFNYVVFPNGLRSIGSKAFGNCTGLKLIVIPESVTTIYKDAFSGCPSDMIIVTGTGSAAAQYAQDNGYPWTSTDSWTTY